MWAANDGAGGLPPSGVSLIRIGTPIPRNFPTTGWSYSAISPPAPSFAAHTASVLADLGYTNTQINALAESGAVLVGENAEPPATIEEQK